MGKARIWRSLGQGQGHRIKKCEMWSFHPTCKWHGHNSECIHSLSTLCKHSDAKFHASYLRGIIKTWKALKA